MIRDTSVLVPPSSDPANRHTDPETVFSTMSCGIHTHTHAKDCVYNRMCNEWAQYEVCRTVFGTGMGMNVTAHIRISPKILQGLILWEGPLALGYYWGNFAPLQIRFDQGLVRKCQFSVSAGVRTSICCEVRHGS